MKDSLVEQNRKDITYARTEAIDVRKVACPPALWVLIPVLKRADEGEVIQILTTDPHDKEDIAQWVRKVGFGVVNALPENGYDRIMVRKSKAK